MSKEVAMRQTVLTVEVNDINDPSKGGVLCLPALVGMEFTGELSRLSEEERATAAGGASIEVSGAVIAAILGGTMRTVVTADLAGHVGKQAERAAKDGASATGYSI